MKRTKTYLNTTKLRSAHEALKALTTPIAWKCYKTVIEAKGLPQEDICDRVKVSQSLVSMSMKAQIKQGLVKKVKDGHRRKHYADEVRFVRMANAINNYVND